MEAKSGNELDVQVSVLDDTIVVTMPGTSYSVTYHKRNDPWLFASNIRDDHNSPISKWTSASSGTRSVVGRTDCLRPYRRIFG